MVKAVTVTGLLFATTLHLACSPFGGASAFTCDEDADCQGGGQTGGRCELSTSFCAFPDEACGPNGRYGSLAGGLSNACVDSASSDGGLDADPDGMPPDPDDLCFGETGLESPCWAPADVPNQPLDLTAAVTIDTTTSSLCSTTVKNTTACVVAASTITLSAGFTLRATGSKPLILVATTGIIQIDGVVDAASHVGVAVLGASANFAGCDAGNAATNGGGGAGGSFGSQGGNGGNGRNMTAGGTSGAAQVAAAVRGGCPGQVGEGTAGIRGEPGEGGGAVYLIGKTGVTIGATGSINASGAGAINATINSQGGGGAGSGGMIVLDAPTITNAGSVFANGGGGGEGSGQNNPGAIEAGGSGDDAIGVTAPAGGSNGTTNGGDGGAGGAAAANGTNGNAGSATGGGGGGGGGIGVIKVFGGGTLAGNRSPGPT